MKLITKNQNIIIDLFRDNIFLSKTTREISKILKKSYPKIHQAIKELNEKSLIKITKVGNSNICELNLSNETISHLSFLDEQEAFSKKIPNIEKILEFKEFLNDIVLVTGSYANSKQTLKSDIDIVIITKDNAFDKQKLIENLTRLFLPKIHPIVITYKDFIEMLLDKKENFGKEIFKKKLLFRNSERYYQLIKEAIENGFRG